MNSYWKMEEELQRRGCPDSSPGGAGNACSTERIGPFSEAVGKLGNSRSSEIRSTRDSMVIFLKKFIKKTKQLDLLIFPSTQRKKKGVEGTGFDVYLNISQNFQRSLACT